MKKRVKIGILLFILLAIGIAGVILYYVYNPKKALNLILPNLNEINNIHIDLKNDKALANLAIVVQNKMPYKMVIDTIHFEIKLNGSKLAEETIAVELNQSKYDTDTVQLPIHLSVKKIQKVIGALEKLDSTDLDLNFSIVYNTFLGKEKFHFKKKIRIACPVIPQIKILKVERKKYSFKNRTIAAIVKIKIINNGIYLDLQLNELTYNLNIKNTLSSKGIIAKSINVKPSSTIIVEIPIDLKLDNPLKTAWLIAIDKDILKYQLNIKSNVKINNVKNINIIPIELDATGVLELMK